MDWTALRNHIYAEMTLLGAVPALQSGQWFDATGGKRRTYVTRVDAARTGCRGAAERRGQCDL